MEFSSYVQYWRNLATNHKDITYFGRLFQEEMDDDMRANLSGVSLILSDYDGVLNYLANGKWIDKQSGSFMLIRRFSERTSDQDDLEAQLDQLKQIGLQLFSRIFYDIANLNHCPDILKNLKRDEIKYFRTPWITTELTGWYFEFLLTEDATLDMRYNPSNWNA